MASKKTRKTNRQVELRSIDSIKAYGNNARTHSEAQIGQIMASLREFGWTNPVLISPKMGVIAGHARLEAARRLGMTEVPCITLDGLTEFVANFGAKVVTRRLRGILASSSAKGIRPNAF